MHIAAYKILVETTIPGIEQLRNTLDEKSKEFMKVVKIGRTHFMDATHYPGTGIQRLRITVGSWIESNEKYVNAFQRIGLGGTAVGTGINTPEAIQRT